MNIYGFNNFQLGFLLVESIYTTSSIDQNGGFLLADVGGYLPENPVSLYMMSEKPSFQGASIVTSCIHALTHSVPVLPVGMYSSSRSISSKK